MKLSLLIITFLLVSIDSYSQEYKGEIFFKDNHSINAKDINLHQDNITFRIGTKSIIDTVDNSKIDYLIVNDGSYFWSSFALGICVGTAGYSMFTEKDDYKSPNLMLTVAATTFVTTLIGSLSKKKKRIDIDSSINTSFLGNVSIMPLANVVNYQLVTISVGL